MNLYPHQQEWIANLRRSLARNQRVIGQAITGFGKSICAKWIMQQSLEREPTEKQSGRILFAVHRRGLVDNISQVLQRDDNTPHGIIMSGNDTDWTQRIQVASIDTALSWWCEGGNTRPPIRLTW